MNHATQKTGRAPGADTDYLVLLGERVRAVRARRGMSRRILSHASGVSERYLAQLEAGKGNASIMVLRAIAAGMNVALDDLVEDRPVQDSAYLLLRERLRHADDETLRHVAGTLGAGSTAAARAHVALIGLRGAGKSTLGRAAAKRLGVPFIELGQEIERTAGMAIGEIFSLGGQTTYRRLEREVLQDCLARFDHAVIAAGGSLVSEPETFELLLTRCYTVWLHADPGQHMERVIAQGDHRPMADNRNAMTDLKRILNERRALYARADASIDTSGETPAASIDRLLALDAVRAIAAR